jgi:hypothetical protein
MSTFFSSRIILGEYIQIYRFVTHSHCNSCNWNGKLSLGKVIEIIKPLQFEANVFASEAKACIHINALLFAIFIALYQLLIWIRMNTYLAGVFCWIMSIRPDVVLFLSVCLLPLCLEILKKEDKLRKWTWAVDSFLINLLVVQRITGVPSIYTVRRLSTFYRRSSHSTIFQNRWIQ